MSESQASTRRERECKQTDQRGDLCSGLQILRDDAEQPFSRARFMGENELYSTAIRRPGWECENGHFDEPEPIDNPGEPHMDARVAAIGTAARYER